MTQFLCICGYDKNEVYVLYGGDAIPKPARGPFSELLFAGEKTAGLLRSATAAYSFDRQAFLDLADSFQNGAMDAFAPGVIDPWKAHGTYPCIMGANDCA